jgi:hypothetical protein
VLGLNETLPRERRTAQYHHANILNELFQLLVACAPEADHNIASWLVYQRGSLSDLSGDEMGQHWRAKNSGKLDLPHLILIAAAYCADAQKVINQDEIAWFYLMEAHSHLGMCRVAKAWRGQAIEAREMVAREARAANAGKSGSANAQVWHRVRDEAYRLIREQVRKGARWDSRTEAARAIGPEVQSFLAELQPRKRFSSDSQRDSKISSWLRHMPEATELFPIRPKKVNGC